MTNPQTPRALPEVRDSRRLTGPNLLWERPGAVLDFAAAHHNAGELVRLWEVHVRQALDAVGWRTQDHIARVFPGGASVAISAPIDALYAATEVNEWAFAAAAAQWCGDTVRGLEHDATELRKLIDEERNPQLQDLCAAARRHGVTFLSDDDHASAGLGSGSRTFAVREIPAPDSLDWDAIHDIPTALITGTNGKSTTVRLVAAMMRAAGRVAGFSSTDGIVVGNHSVESGDYSGPGGARTVLRNRGVDVALLETARGGMLRRGLGVPRARVALVTNVDEDHLGEFGVADLAALAETKLIVARAIGPDGLLVLNADDTELAARGQRLDVPLAWFTLKNPDSALVHPVFREHVARGGAAAWLEEETFVIQTHGRLRAIARLDEVPATFGGVARHNVSNCLGAALVATGLELSDDHVAEGLRQFNNTPDENPGRCNVFDLNGVTAIVDFAHNPHGVRALFDMSQRLPARRRLVLLGQAGDRDDDAIRALVQMAWQGEPDHVIIKEMTVFLRGREPGTVPALIEAELLRLGARRDGIAHAASELDGVRDALNWSEPGDLLLLLSHSDRSAVLELMKQLQATGWQPGRPLPA